MKKGSVKNIAIIGHLVWDKINHANGRTIEDFGGIAYNLAALSTVVNSSTRIFPICYLGEDLELKARNYWKRSSNIDFSYAKTLAQRQEIHVLTYDRVGYRKEDNRNLFPPLNISLFNDCPNFDIALVNYIGGDEFPPANLRWFKNNFKSLIYLDFHSLALSRVARNRRYFRCHPHWRKYTALADIVQMNYYELKTLFPGIKDETAQIMDSAFKVMETGPRAVIITRENKNLIAIWRAGKKVSRRAFPVSQVSKVVDSTGCGDSFAAGFVNGLCQGKGIEACCQEGLRLASRKITFSGPDGFFRKI
jgi:adenosine kinase